jgi:hypothetical protein
MKLLSYQVVPLALPSVLRNGILYTCTEKFRCNFNGNLGDVRLVYQDKDKRTWNMEIFSRKSVKELQLTNLFDKFANNDEEMVQRYAFDHENISKNGGSFLEELPFSIKGPSVQELLGYSNDVTLKIYSDCYLPVKNRKIFSDILDLPNTKLLDYYKQGGFSLPRSIQLNRRFMKGCELVMNIEKFKNYRLDKQLDSEHQESARYNKGL